MSFANASGALTASTANVLYTQSGTQQGSVHTLSLSNSTSSAITVDVGLYSYANATLTIIYDQISVSKGTPWVNTKAIDLMPGDYLTANPSATGMKYNLSAFIDTAVTATTFNPRGAWSSASTYNTLDLVSYGGGSWIALQTSLNQTPAAGAYWMQNAAQGTAGTLSGAVSGDITFAGYGAIGESYTEVAKGSVSSGTVTFTLSAGNSQTLTVAGALTIAFAGWPTTGHAAAMLLRLTNAGSAAVTVTTVNWVLPSGSLTTSISAYLTAISRTLQTSGVDWAVIWNDDGGTTLYGKLL